MRDAERWRAAVDAGGSVSCTSGGMRTSHGGGGGDGGGGGGGDRDGDGGAGEREVARRGRARGGFEKAGIRDECAVENGPEADRWRALCSLRWFALVHVLIWAFYGQLGLPGWDAFAAAGAAQIAFFFALSGFLLARRHLAAVAARQFDYTSFVTRRLWRVVPVYAFVILLLAVQSWAIVDAKQLSSHWRQIVAAALMLQTWLPGGGIRLTASASHEVVAGPHAVDAVASCLGALLFCSVVMFPAWMWLFAQKSPRELLLRVLPAVWLCTLLAEHHRGGRHLVHTLEWYINYVPFRAHAPLFLAGVTLGIAFERRDRAFDKIFAHIGAAYLAPVVLIIALLCAGQTVVLAEHGHFGGVSSSGFVPLLARWLLSGALLPFFGALLWCIALPVPRNVAREQPFDAFPGPRTYSILGSRAFELLGRISFAAFVAHPVVWAFARHFSCRTAASEGSKFLNGLCWVTPSDQVVSPLLYFPLLFSLALVLHFVIELPINRTLDAVLPSQASLEREAALACTRSADDALRSQTSLWNRASLAEIWHLVVIYFAGMFVFALLVFRIGTGNADGAAQHAALYAPSNGASSTALLRVVTWLGRTASFVLERVKWIAVVSVFPLAANVLGHIVIPSLVHQKLPSAHSRARLPQNAVLYFRIVTRGTNPLLVRRNVEAAHAVLHGYIPSDSFVIEVVTDHDMQLSQLASVPVQELVVPSSYSTSSGAKYKARALQYAIEVSGARDFDWIVHLDEETRFEERTVDAIFEHIEHECQHARGCDAAGTLRLGDDAALPAVGQGTVMYGNGTDIANVVTTLADSYRVADDYGKFRIQYSMGEVLVGMHGSFVVCCNRVERAVGFDHGLAGSITEDTYFAFKARALGVKFRWLDAVMYEQSPFTVLDFMRQRARWLGGLIRVCLESSIPLRHRAVLWALNIVWMLLPLSLTVLYARTLVSFAESNTLSGRIFNTALSVVQALACWSYVHGFFMAYSVRSLGISRYLVLLYLQLALQPLFGIIEAAGVCYALLNLRSVLVGFHVVKKELEVLPEPSTLMDESTEKQFKCTAFAGAAHANSELRPLLGP